MNETTTSGGTPVALVTGGRRGIGLGIARALQREGWQVVITGRQPTAATDEFPYFAGDLTDRGVRVALVEFVRARFGRLDLLVNNAGIAPRVRADLLQTDEASFEEVWRTNLQAPYFLTQLVARWMIEQQRGMIIFISSISATVASVNRGEYCVSKAALAMAAQLWAVRLAEFGIPVYEVRPGIIQTDMTAPVKEKYDRLIAGGLVPQRRWGLPDDVGRAVVALARGDFPYSTGHVFVVDGGLTIARL